ncbi:MAG: ribonuclease P protein component [Ginsengibacter sp.]
MTHLFTLKAHERLKSRKVIQQLFKEGQSFSHFPFRIIFLEVNDQTSQLRTGFSVSKRHFKKAVDRNKIKRLMRESYRLQKNNLKDLIEKNQTGLAVFIIYTIDALPTYKDIFEKMGTALERLQKKVSKDNL